MPLKTPWVCILYWAPQRMGVVWLSLSYPVPWLQARRGQSKARAGPQAPCGTVQQKECFQSSPDKSWVLPPCTGLLWKQGFVKGGAARSWCHHHAAPPHAQVLTDAQHRLGLCLSQTSQGEPQGQEFVIPSKVFTLQMAGLTHGYKYLRNEQMPQVHSECNGCLSAPHDSGFTR